MTEDYDSPMEQNGYQSTSGFPENGYEPDEEDPDYRTEFDERVARMTERDIEERIRNERTSQTV